MYLQWHVLNAAADSLSQAFVDENFEFNGRFLSGAKTIKPRAIRCAESTDNLLGEALGKAYVAKYFPPEAKARMEEMVKNILLAMDDTIKGLEWMDADTKKKALEKRASYMPKIGYPDKWKDYKGVVVTRDSYFDDIMSASKWFIADNRAQLKPTLDKLNDVLALVDTRKERIQQAITGLKNYSISMGETASLSRL